MMPAEGSTPPAALLPFAFEGAAVRTLVDAVGAPWFVAADLCRVLEIGNTAQAVSRLDDDERGIITADTPGGRQRFTAVSESGMFGLVLTSRKPAARRFKRWVTGEVLPSIRRTGGYGGPPPDPLALLNDPATLRRLLGDYAERQQALEARVEVAEAGLARIAKAEGTYCITDAAKALQMAPAALFAWLEKNRWIYRRTPSSGEGKGVFQGFSDKITRGLLEHKLALVPRATGDRSYAQVRVTAAGLARLAEVMSIDSKGAA